MDDYTKFGVTLITCSILFCLAVPIWGPIYGIVWCFKHKEWAKEKAIIKERYIKEQERVIESNRIAAENKVKYVKQKPWSKEKIEELRNKLY